MRSRFAVGVLAVLVATLACKREVAPPPVTPPTQAEAEAFAKDFESVVGSCDENGLDRTIDFVAFGARAVAGHRMSKRELETMQRQLRDTMASTLCDQLVDSDYVHLHTQMIDGTPRPLFRLVDPAGSFNYHLVELGRREGKVRLVDVYLYTTGENMSATFRNLLDTMKNHSGHATTLKINRMTQLRLEGKHAEARELLHQLPAEMRKTKAAMLMDVMLADVEDPSYLTAIDAYIRAFPNDPSLDLVRLDALYLRKKFDEAHAIIDQLDKRVGGDPYLDSLRAGLFGEAGEHDKAIAAAKRATEREPSLESAWWQLLTQQSAMKDYAAATRTLDVLADRFDASFENDVLAADARYVGLAESKEYAAWLERPGE